LPDELVGVPLAVADGCCGLEPARLESLAE
jgi:hypothetical protein